MSAAPKTSYFDSADFEAEKALITSYEEGWDRWDGPVWPVGTNQISKQAGMIVSAPPTPAVEKDADAALPPTPMEQS